MVLFEFVQVFQLWSPITHTVVALIKYKLKMNFYFVYYSANTWLLSRLQHFEIRTDKQREYNHFERICDCMYCYQKTLLPIIRMENKTL